MQAILRQTSSLSEKALSSKQAVGATSAVLQLSGEYRCLKFSSTST